MNDLFKKEKIIWEAKIRKAGKEYESFVCIKSLPTYKIKFIEDLENVTYSMQVLNTTRPFILNINIGFMLDKDFDYISTAFHEFTHIYDYSFLLQDKNEEYRKTALPLFSEFHASYIQCLYLLGVSNITDLETKNLSFDKLNHKINSNIFFVNESINKYREQKNVVNFYSIINAYMYYYGSIVAYNQHSKTQKDVLSFNFKFQDDMERFYSILKFRVFDDRILEVSYKIKTYFDNVIITELLL